MLWVKTIQPSNWLNNFMKKNKSCFRLELHNILYRKNEKLKLVSTSFSQASSTSTKETRQKATLDHGSKWQKLKFFIYWLLKNHRNVSFYLPCWLPGIFSTSSLCVRYLFICFFNIFMLRFIWWQILREESF